MAVVVVDSRWRGVHGIQRFAREVLNRRPETASYIDLVGGPSHGSPLGPIWLSTVLLSKSGDVFFSPAYIAPVLCRMPTVITVHDLIPIKTLTKHAVAKSLFFNRVIRPAAKRAFRILTVSEFSRREIIDWLGCGPDRVVSVGNGVDPFFCPTDSVFDRTPYFLYVGGNKPHKNLGRVVEAFVASGLSKGHQLLLTGNPIQILLSKCKSLGIDKNVFFTGPVSDDELLRLYRFAVALVFPSLYEGFGLPAAEAMACGTPVIVSNTTSLPEVVDSAGIFVDPCDVDSIAAAMIRISHDINLRNDLRARGIEQAKQHSWQKTASLVWENVIAAAQEGTA